MEYVAVNKAILQIILITKRNRYTSEIKTIYNNHVLIIHDDWENTGYYGVHHWSNNYTHGVTIALQFDLADKATNILNDI